MEGLHLNRRTVFLWADLALVTAALCCTTYFICDLADGLSFGGFFVLFMLVVLGLYFMGLLGALIFMGLLGALILLPLSIRSGRARFAVIAAILQAITPLPWLRLVRAFESSFSWFEFIMLAGVVAAAALLFALPFWSRRDQNE